MPWLEEHRDNAHLELTRENAMHSLMTSPLVADPGWHGHAAWWVIFPVLWLLVIAGIATALVLLGRRRRQHAGPMAGERRLAERFASGEIDDEEYRARLAVLKEQAR
ncbi:MAG: SHOCT domain-containing protein [Nocardioidaceae bacterium]